MNSPVATQEIQLKDGTFVHYTPFKVKHVRRMSRVQDQESAEAMDVVIDIMEEIVTDSYYTEGVNNDVVQLPVEEWSMESLQEFLEIVAPPLQV